MEAVVKPSVLGNAFFGAWLLLALLASRTALAHELPAFRDIVRDNAAAVVHISVESRGSQAPAAWQQGQPGAPDMPGLPDLFKRFGLPFDLPGQPQARPQRGMGSGFVISADGRILTNAHVVKGADEILVKFVDRRELPAKLIGIDERADIAILQVEAEGLKTVRLGDPASLQVGDWVLAIGSPFGLDHTATQGIVSALGRNLPDDTYVPFIQTDVAVNPGNSGGPLFNTQGEVVGINSQIFSRSGGYMGLSFAIPIDTAIRVATQLEEKGYVTRGWLGVTIQPLAKGLAEAFGMDKPSGALVAAVTPDGPAAAADIRSGDIIVRFDGKPVETSAQLPPLVGDTPAGSRVPVEVLRDGKRVRLQVKVGELQEDRVAQASPAEPPTEEKLGMRVAPVTGQPSEDGEARGVRVIAVGPGPAAGAGLRPGDILVELNGARLDSVEDFRRAAAGLEPGSFARVLVRREQGRMFIAIRVPEGSGIG